MSGYRRPTFRPSPIDRSLAFRQHAATLRTKVDPFGIREASALANEVPPLLPMNGEHLADQEVAEAIRAGRYEREAGSCHDRLVKLARRSLERIEVLEALVARLFSARAVAPPSILMVDLASVRDEHQGGTCAREDVR